MIIVKAYTMFGEIQKKFDSVEKALKWIRIHMENDVPVGVVSYIK